MSTVFDITLEIAYHYDRPVGASRTLLRMQPLNLPEQVLISGLTSIDPPPDDRRDRRDFFGNPTIEIAHNAPLRDVRFRFAGRVRRMPSLHSLDLSGALSDLADEILEIRSLDAMSPHHYLRGSDRVALDSEITRFAEGVVTPSQSVLQAVQAVAHALHETMTFDPEATEVSTPAIEAFRARRGVCQDFTHIMIAALRGLGIPAGYVSGFLRTMPPPGRERLAGADAMHAWVRAWCGGEIGWVEIDPTNDLMVDSDHVVVARGRDYGDVAPVKGAHWTSGKQRSVQEVDVVPVVLT